MQKLPNIYQFSSVSFYCTCAIPSHEQMFQCEASGNEAGGEEGAALDAESKVPACAFEGEIRGRSICRFQLGFFPGAEELFAVCEGEVNPRGESGAR